MQQRLGQRQTDNDWKLSKCGFGEGWKELAGLIK